MPCPARPATFRLGQPRWCATPGSAMTSWPSRSIRSRSPRAAPGSSAPGAEANLPRVETDRLLVLGRRRTVRRRRHRHPGDRNRHRTGRRRRRLRAARELGGVQAICIVQIETPLPIDQLPDTGRYSPRTLLFGMALVVLGCCSSRARDPAHGDQPVRAERRPLALTTRPRPDGDRRVSFRRRLPPTPTL